MQKYKQPFFIIIFLCCLTSVFAQSLPFATQAFQILPEYEAHFASGTGIFASIDTSAPIIEPSPSGLLQIAGKLHDNVLTPPGRLVVGADDWFFWDGVFTSTSAGACALNIVQWITKFKHSPDILVDSWFNYYVSQGLP